MSCKRVLIGCGVAALGALLAMPGVAKAASATVSLASAAPALVEQHADAGLPLLCAAGVIGAAMRRQRAWYRDPRLARMLAPLPQDYTYLPPR